MSTALQFGAHFEDGNVWKKEAWMVCPQASSWMGPPEQGCTSFLRRPSAIFCTFVCV